MDLETRISNKDGSNPNCKPTKCNQHLDDEALMERIFRTMDPLFSAYGWTDDEFSWTNLTGTMGGVVMCSFATPSLSFWSTLPLPDGRTKARPLPHHDGAPRHTVAEDSGLLGSVIEAMPHMLAPGGIALLYTQAWPGGDRSLPEALHDAFAHRPWRGAFWWDHAGDPDHGAPRAGVLAVRADATHGWTARQRQAAPSWDGLAALLDEG